MSDASSDPSDRGPGRPASPAPGATPRRPERVRLVSAEVDREQGARARVRVVLALGGREHHAELQGVGEEVMVLRLTALATLAALERATGDADRFSLVGVKHVTAFDSSVVLVCLRCGDPGVGRLLGCVPAPEGLVRGAAASVLNATNRLVGWPATRGRGAVDDADPEERGDAAGAAEADGVDAGSADGVEDRAAGGRR